MGGDVRIEAERERASITILNIGGMYDQANQIALRIGDDMALASLDLLARVVSRADRRFPWFSPIGCQGRRLSGSARVQPSPAPP